MSKRSYIKQADEYFGSLGVMVSTPMRTVRNRSRLFNDLMENYTIDGDNVRGVTMGGDSFYFEMGVKSPDE